MATRELAAVEVTNLSVYFKGKRGFRRSSELIPAVRDVSFQLFPGRSLGIAGESGSGKSTIARALMRVHKPTGGTIRVDGAELGSLHGTSLRHYRRRIQMVYQDPYDSLDPRMRVGDTISEGLAVQGMAPLQRASAVREMLSRVGLPANHSRRYPRELSGGQRQRVSIARALAVNPSFIVCDEAVSALDVSVRAQILNLLKELQEGMGLAYLFISHDLSVLRFISDDIAIMYLGRFVEFGARDQVFNTPQHPYTRALIAAIPEPRLKKAGGGPRARLRGETPSPVSPPSGCTFHPRCPIAQAICGVEAPVLRHAATGQIVACHFAEPARKA